MMDTRSISNPVLIGLRLTGIWPGFPHEIIVRLIWVVDLASAQIFQYRYVLKHLSLDTLTDFVDSVGTSLPYSLLCFKLISFWTNRGIFRNILLRMSHDWTYSVAAKHNVDVMINKSVLAYQCSKLIMAIYAIAVFVYASVFLELGDQSQDGGFNRTSRELLMKMDLPFAYYDSPIYEYVFVVQFVQLLSTAFAIAMLDALIISLIFHIGGQIEMLHNDIANVSVKNEEFEVLRIQIKSLINRHYRIIINAEYVESLFSYIALIQLFCNTLVICSVGFIIIVAINSHGDIKVFIKISFFYIAITTEAFIFSFAGEYLSNKSLSINNSAYDSLWYLLKPRDRRALVLLMIRSQRPLTITAGKFMDLSLEGFANILKASASYVSVLYAMY
ncbi:PREDICTED: odorant receptor 85b-like [Eufriesea mexicana]|uniref:odorant receptor 85b-like n=1 Tax=Eufriesea mexicana TaxID=516756 RepID=UPI00083C0C12|nr:PREDICTED: odorant receptor 85b-like [Eufriesea mexicana]